MIIRHKQEAGVVTSGRLALTGEAFCVPNAPCPSPVSGGPSCLINIPTHRISQLFLGGVRCLSQSLTAVQRLFLGNLKLPANQNILNNRVSLS